MTQVDEPELLLAGTDIVVVVGDSDFDAGLAEVVCIRELLDLRETFAVMRTIMQSRSLWLLLPLAQSQLIRNACLPSFSAVVAIFQRSLYSLSTEFDSRRSHASPASDRKCELEQIVATEAVTSPLVVTISTPASFTPIRTCGSKKLGYASG